jgi:hypothetical protein
MANPDFPERVKAGAALNEQRPELYYTKEAEGYTDFPIMATSYTKEAEGYTDYPITANVIVVPPSSSHAA